MTLAANGREVVRATLRGRASPRPPFIPFVYSLAARLAQVSLYDMAHDPTLLANSLAQAQALFGYDAVVIAFDATIAAEACGCEVAWSAAGPEVHSHPWKTGVDLSVDAVVARGRVPVIVEVARRLHATSGQDAALVGALSGPWMLARQLYGPDFSRNWTAGAPDAADCLKLALQVGVKIARLFGEARVDAFLVMEVHPLPNAAEGRNPLHKTHRPLWNVARFFNAPGILALREHGLPDVVSHGLAELGAAALALGQPARGAGVPWPNSRVASGRAIAATALAGSPESVAAAVSTVANGAPASAWFLTTEWEIPADTPPENLHEAVAAARALEDR